MMLRGVCPAAPQHNDDPSHQQARIIYQQQYDQQAEQGNKQHITVVGNRCGKRVTDGKGSQRHERQYKPADKTARGSSKHQGERHAGKR